MSTSFNLREVTINDWKVLLEWRNDKITRQNFFHTGSISPGKHKNWLKYSLSIDGRTIFILEYNEIPVGTIREDIKKGKFELSFTISPKHRGNKLGQIMMSLYLFERKGLFLCEVKKENIPSIKMIEKFGFKLFKTEKKVNFYQLNKADQSSEINDFLSNNKKIKNKNDINLKTLTAHQPAYLPWLGYFDKIISSDIYIYLDTVQLEKNSFSCRNKIKTPQGGAWITIPIKRKGTSSIAIKDICIDNSKQWKKKHLKNFYYNYQKAPFFDDLYPRIEELYNQSFELFSDLAYYHLLFWVKELNIKTKIVKSSDLSISSKKSDLILDLCQHLNADKYISGVEGKYYLDAKSFKKEKINVEFQNYQHPVYQQLNGSFISHMSVIDLLFNEGPNSNEIIMSGNYDNQYYPHNKVLSDIVI